MASRAAELYEAARAMSAAFAPGGVVAVVEDGRASPRPATVAPPIRRRLERLREALAACDVASKPAGHLQHPCDVASGVAEELPGTAENLALLRRALAGWRCHVAHGRDAGCRCGDELAGVLAHAAALVGVRE